MRDDSKNKLREAGFMIIRKGAGANGRYTVQVWSVRHTWEELPPSFSTPIERDEHFDELLKNPKCVDE